MNEAAVRALIQGLRDGTVTDDAFLRKIRALPFEDLGDVKFDTHRSLRKGFSEIVYCPGKTDDHLRKIAGTFADRNEPVLFSRAAPAQYDVVRDIIPDAVHYPKARMIGLRPPVAPGVPGLTVVTAGSSDIPVAEEAAVTAEYMGCAVERLFDVGVAGIHRLLSHLPLLQSSKAIVAVAGMEGALPGVLAGLVACPVIAVPTSTGYGANLGGIAPLLTMLNSCASGVSVVNIDNGLGGGYTGAIIALQGRRDAAGHERE
jgi:NCAIR mutase (PurE)-related protein